MIALGLDPGTEQSAMVAFDGQHVVQNYGTLLNVAVLHQLRTFSDTAVPVVLVIEQIESFGMAVGKETFETVFWTGRFAEAWAPHHRRFARLTRKTIKQHLCHTARATDANIRQALLDRFGPGKDKAIGRKATPGPLYGMKGHEFAALAVAVTYFDQHERIV